MNSPIADFMCEVYNKGVQMKVITILAPASDASLGFHLNNWSAL